MYSLIQQPSTRKVQLNYGGKHPNDIGRVWVGAATQPGWTSVAESESKKRHEP